MKTYLHLGIGFLLLIILSSCAGTSPFRSQENTLDERVDQYHDLFRWRDYETASAFLLPSVRKDFVATTNAWQHDLNVSEYQIKRISLEESGKEAAVIVARSFFKMPSVTLQQEEIRQRWILVSGNWYLAGPPY